MSVIQFPKRKKLPPEAMEIYDRLSAMLEADRAAILADPLPYLAEMEGRVCVMYEAVENALTALMGTSKVGFVTSSDEPIMARSITEEAYDRNREAYKILHKSIETFNNEGD